MAAGPLKAFLAVPAIGALLVACSGGGDAALTSPSSTARVTAPVRETTSTIPAPPTTSAVADTELCASSGLTVEMGEGRSALGRGLYVFELRNTSTGPCRLLGYPAATLVDAQGRPVADAQPESGRLLADRPPTPVVVAPGESVFVGLESANVCNDGARPTASRTVRITPPGAAEGVLTVAATVTVCPGQAVLISPVRATEPELTR